jgi:hypothetical protein
MVVLQLPSNGYSKVMTAIIPYDSLPPKAYSFQVVS